MITPSFSLTSTERVLPKLALDFTTASLDPRVTFTRSGDTATYTNSLGVITTINADLPRFDYNPTTLICQGLLIEEAKTNVLLNSLIDGTSLATQDVTTTAAARTLSFYGTGSVELSGTHTATVTGTGAYPARKTYTFTPTAGTLTLTVTGTVQFAQLEIGSFATSFIPTDDTSKTRNADVATMTGTNFSDWFNATEGTFAVNASVIGQKTSFRGILAASDGTNSTHIGFLQGSNGYTVRGNVLNGGNGQATFTLGTVTNGTNFKASLAYKADSFAGSLNADTPLTDVSGTVPTVSLLNIGYYGTTDQNTCYIQKIFYWPQRLTNAEVRAFSK